MSEIRKWKLEIRLPTREFRIAIFCSHFKRSAIGNESQDSGFRNQESEVRSQELEDRIQEALRIGAVTNGEKEAEARRERGES
jgi:hypothetical protein